MNKQSFRWTFLAVAAMLFWLVVSVLGMTQASAQGGSVTIEDVQVSNVRDGAFTVSWITDQVVTGTLRYGTEPANLNQTADDDRGANTTDDTHYVTVLSGLSPNTTYYFDVVSGDTTDDNGGTHYQVTTGATLGIADNDTIYGQVVLSDTTTPAEGTIIYVTLRDNNGEGSSGDAALQSTLVEASGYWIMNLANGRTSDLSGYFSYSASGGDQLFIEAQGAGDGTGSQTVDTANDSAIPAMPLAVSLASFTATPGEDSILLEWETVLEIDNLGFNVWRSNSPDAPTTLLNEELIPSQAPGSGQGFAYSWQDNDVEAGTTYYYWLEDIDSGGVTTLHGPVSATANDPTAVGVASLSTEPISLPWQAFLLGISLLAAIAGLVQYASRSKATTS